MFNKLKQFKDLRDQAKTLQNTLSGESVTVNEMGGNITLTMDGNMKIKELSIKQEVFKPENKKRVEDGIKDAVENAHKKIQRIMAMKVKDMGGLDQFKF